MMRRENSFMKLKQEQWAKERAEKENTTEWFPFGENLKPGGGSPLRKFEPKEPPAPSVDHINNHFGIEDENEIEDDDRNNIQQKSAEEMEKKNEENQQQHYQYAGVPLYPAFPYPYGYQQQQGQQWTEMMEAQQQNQQPFQNHVPWPYAYQVIPPNAIPVSTINIDPSQICPVDQLAALWNLLQAPPGVRYGIPIPPPPQTPSASVHHSNLQFMNPSMTSSVSSSESGISGLTSKRENHHEQYNNHNEHHKHNKDHEEKQSTSDYNEDEPPSRKTTTDSMHYEEQIAERRKSEIEEERQEMLQQLEADKQMELMEMRRDQEDEKRKEIEKKRIEEERRRSEQFVLAMEKAKKEAELLKKAKVFKHVLDGEDEGQLDELKQKLLGVDVKTSQRLLREVSDLEHRKMRDAVEIQKNAPKREVVTHRPRSSSIAQSSHGADNCGLMRNGFGRRSVRTTSREKMEQQRNKEQIHQHHQQGEGSERWKGNGSEGSREEENMKYYRTVLRNDEDEVENDEHTKFFIRNSIANGGSKQHNLEHGQFNSNSGFGAGRHSAGNNLKQSALFGQIPTRLNSSGRRSMRVPAMQTSPTGIASNEDKTVFVAPRSDSFEEELSVRSDGSLSPDQNHNTSSPQPTENIYSKSNGVQQAERQLNDEHKEFKLRTRSALSSPSSYLMNGGSMRCASPAGSSKFMQKLEQRGAIKRDEDCLSPAIRRVAESNLSRASSMASIGSMHNLAQLKASVLNLSSSGEPSPNLSKFHSMTSPARQSLSNRIKNTTERQQSVLDRLNRLRDSLHSAKNFTPTRQSRLGSSGQSPQASPSKPM